MKKVLLLFLLILTVQTAFSVENTIGKEDVKEENLNSDEENSEKETDKENTGFDFKIYNSTFKKTKLKGKTSPKLEQLKTKLKTQKSVEQRKKEFEKRKNEELMLLQKEYQILDYK